MNPFTVMSKMQSMIPGNNNGEPKLSKAAQKKLNAKYMYKTITNLKAHEVKSLVNAILDSMCIVTSNEQVNDAPHPGDASPTYKGIHSLADELTDTIFSKVVDQLNSEESTSNEQTGGEGMLTRMAKWHPAVRTASTALEKAGDMKDKFSGAAEKATIAIDAVKENATDVVNTATESATGAGALDQLTNKVAGATKDIAGGLKNKVADATDNITEGGEKGKTEEKDDEVSDGEITEDEVDDDDKESDLKEKTLNHLRKRIIQTIQRGGFENLIKSIKITADNHLKYTDITKNPKFEDIMKIMAEKDIKLLESHMEFMLYKIIENSENNKDIDNYISMILVLKHFNKNNSLGIDVDLNQYKLKNGLIEEVEFNKNKGTYIQKAKSNLKKYGLSSYDNIKDDMDKTIDATKLTELIQESQDKTTGGTRRYKKKGKRLTKRNKPRKH